jgi:hypothetical protein
VRSAAVKLYQKRKTEILEGKKPPEQLRGRVVRFAEIIITIPKSKNGNTRHIPLNSIALAAFQDLFARSSGQGRGLLICKGSR